MDHCGTTAGPPRDHRGTTAGPPRDHRGTTAGPPQDHARRDSNLRRRIRFFGSMPGRLAGPSLPERSFRTAAAEMPDPTCAQTEIGCSAKSPPRAKLGKMFDFVEFLLVQDHISMANTKQTRKRARQAVVRNVHNTALRSSLRTAIKSVRKAVAAGDNAAVTAVFRHATRLIDYAAYNKTLHKNTAAGNKSRLSAALKAMA